MKKPLTRKEKDLAEIKKELESEIQAEEEENDGWSGGMFAPATQADLDWLRHVGKLQGVIPEKNKQ